LLFHSEIAFRFPHLDDFRAGIFQNLISVSVDTVMGFWEIPAGKGEVRGAKSSFLSGIYVLRNETSCLPSGTPDISNMLVTSTISCFYTAMAQSFESTGLPERDEARNIIALFIGRASLAEAYLRARSNPKFPWQPVDENLFSFMRGSAVVPAAASLIGEYGRPHPKVEGLHCLIGHSRSWRLNATARSTEQGAVSVHLGRRRKWPLNYILQDSSWLRAPNRSMTHAAAYDGEKGINETFLLNNDSYVMLSRDVVTDPSQLEGFLRTSRRLMSTLLEVTFLEPPAAAEN
jgi:hypothetical protein